MKTWANLYFKKTDCAESESDSFAEAAVLFMHQIAKEFGGGAVVTVYNKECNKAAVFGVAYIDGVDPELLEREVGAATVREFGQANQGQGLERLPEA